MVARARVPANGSDGTSGLVHGTPRHRARRPESARWIRRKHRSANDLSMSRIGAGCSTDSGSWRRHRLREPAARDAFGRAARSRCVRATRHGTCDGQATPVRCPRRRQIDRSIPDRGLGNARPGLRPVCGRLRRGSRLGRPAERLERPPACLGSCISTDRGMIWHDAGRVGPPRRSLNQLYARPNPRPLDSSGASGEMADAPALGAGAA
jgi:hypothetical protein